MKYFLLYLCASSASGFSAPPLSSSLTSSSSSSTGLSMSAALIVQNKGGGHGELGFQLAKKLSSNTKITSITILQDDACKDTAEPFKSYSTDLPDVKVVKASLSGDEEMTAKSIQSALNGESFDYIWDNCSKGASGTGKAVVDCAKEWNCNLLTYVSSAGCYVPTADTTFPMSEADTPVKESGQVQYENYAVEQGLPFVSFRPQYIYGPKSNKYDYVDWYFDRIVRDLPLPIPGDGSQKVSLTNSEDVASLLASVLNDEEAAVKQRIFNCGTDELLTYTEVAELCAGVVGKKANICFYDGDKFGKANFPFRLTNFYVAPTLAKEKLNWNGSSRTLKEDLSSWYYDSYKARGGETGEVKNLDKDQEITTAQ